MQHKYEDLRLSTLSNVGNTHGLLPMISHNLISHKLYCFISTCFLICKLVIIVIVMNRVFEKFKCDNACKIIYKIFDEFWLLLLPSRF